MFFFSNSRGATNFVINLWLELSMALLLIDWGSPKSSVSQESTMATPRISVRGPSQRGGAVHGCELFVADVCFSANLRKAELRKMFGDSTLRRTK